MSVGKAKGQFSKILVAIDGSQSSMDAAEYAIEMVRKDGAQLIALTVNRLPLSSYGISTPQDEVEYSKEKEDMNESGQYLDNISQMAKQKSVEIKTKILSTQMSIEGAIVEYAESQGVDLIVIGTRGRSGLKKMLLGSVASGVATYATCPVMVVK
ncbi:MAG: universal stress protein [Nitrososphaeraceae archaeon]